jgi:excisionase family DNA binding protein
MNTPERRWWTIFQTAAYLGISIKGCYAMAAAGKIPVARIGRRVLRVDGQALDAFLTSQSQGTPAPVRGKGRTR